MVSKINTTFKCCPLFPLPFFKAGEVLPQSGREGGFTLPKKLNFRFRDLTTSISALLQFALLNLRCPFYAVPFFFCSLYAVRCSLYAVRC